MARRALSATKRKQIHQEIHAKCMARAVAMYEDERAKPAEVKKLSLRAVCEAVQKEYFKSDGVMCNPGHPITRYCPLFTDAIGPYYIRTP